MTPSLLPLIGIDTGGTFTDFVVHDSDGLRIHKELSTPSAPDQAIVAGLAALGMLGRPARIVHGSTVATNAVLEGKGARTVFVTNRGFADVLSIGRQARAELYNLTPLAAPPPVAAELCVETGGRIGADGSVVELLTADDIAALVETVRQLAPDAIAISLLFSFLDDRFERSLADALAGCAEVVCHSSAVLPEQREYERGLATWLNAFVGPLMQRYLQTLEQSLRPAHLSVMQSSGQTCAPAFGARHGVNLLVSGPAAGLLGARHVAALVGCERVLTFDMGGTSTDVALVDGELSLTSEGAVGPYPVAVPMVDLHTIGAGGGSLARVDAAGLLHVGPQSAGAVPGPACYGRGGTVATVTDAHVVLGRIPAGLRLGGRLQLDIAAAHAAVAAIATALGGIALADAAQGIIALANEHMQQALRVISVERGIDPRAFTLVSFGGAGGLHVCALAGALGLKQALVPAQAGVLSALGMIVAAPGRQLAQAVRRPLAAVSDADIAAGFAHLRARGVAALTAEGHAADELQARLHVDMCYRGQSYALTLPWTTRDDVTARYHAEHEQRYGHTLARTLELVSLRAAVTAAAPVVNLYARPPAAVAAALAAVVPVYDHVALANGQHMVGPAIVTSVVGTTFIEAGWSATADGAGNLRLAVE